MTDYRWLVYALISALAASLVAIFGKLGLGNIDSTVATTIRSFIMTLFLAAVLFLSGLGSKIILVRGWSLFSRILISAFMLAQMRAPLARVTEGFRRIDSMSGLYFQVDL